MKTTTEITEILENLSDNELFDLWNEYQSEIKGESQVYEFDDNFFETYFSTPYEAARATYFGKIDNWSAKYIQFNGYGNLEAGDYLSEMISIYDLANYIERNTDNFSHLLDD